MQNRIPLPQRSVCPSFVRIAAGPQRFFRSWQTFFMAAPVLLCVLLLGMAAQPVLAQSTEEPPIAVVAVETAQFPTMQLTVNGANWPTARADTPLQVFVDGEAQTILADRLTSQGISFMVAINPNDLFANGQAGQTRYVQMTGAMLDLIENESLLRNQDWMAAYLLLPTAVQSIQTWTQEPNTVFNSIALNRPPEVTGTPLATATLVGALQEFTASPAQADQPRTLLLISTQAEGLEVATIVAAAQELGVQIHVVELPSSENPAGADSPLAQVAQQTGGDYIVLDSPSALPPLWQRIAADHNQRVVTFQSTAATPQTIEVRLPITTGTPLSAMVDPTLLAALPVVATGAAPSVQNVMTSSDTAVANQAPAGDQAVAAAQPAPNGQVPADEAGVADTTGPAGAVVIPGLQIALPRSVLQGGLLLLLVLIGYFVYAEVRDRRKKRKRGGQRSNQQNEDHYQAPDHFLLDDNSQPLGASPFHLNTHDDKVESGFVVDPPLARVAPPPKLATQPPARTPVRPTTFVQEDDEIEATIRPRMEDDEATYRVQEVEQPILGYLVRATSDPNLPKELPVYGLNPAPGEVRQIHIGRHSKHNTVVINDKSISREHAVIIQRSGRLYLRDNASTSGTFLNWKRLNPGEELLLRHNDLISFGQIVYEFRLHGEDEVTIAEA